MKKAIRMTLLVLAGLCFLFSNSSSILAEEPPPDELKIVFIAYANPDKLMEIGNQVLAGTTDLVLVMHTGGRIYGRVRADKGISIQHFRVQAQEASGILHQSQLPPNGHFEFARLGPGLVRVELWKGFREKIVGSR